MQKTLCAMLVLAVAGIAAAAEKSSLKSGLKEGAFVGAFNVQDCTGPSKGTTLCYRCKFGGRPVVSVFARKLDDNVLSLVKAIDGKVADHSKKNMRSFVVLLTDDPDKAEPQLVSAAKKNKLSTPLTIFDGPAGPPSYKINKNADVTVLMWTGGKVKTNVGLKQSDLNAKTIKQIVAEADALVK